MGFFSLANLSGLPKFEALFAPIIVERRYFVSVVFLWQTLQDCQSLRRFSRRFPRLKSGVINILDYPYY